MPIRLYIGNLPKELERQELEAVFADVGDAVSTKVITDRKTGKCRGFGFVTVKTDEQADEIIEKFNGFVLKESAIKIEKALPRSKGGEREEGDDNGAPEQFDPNSNSGEVSGNNRRKNTKKTKRGSSGAVTTPSSDATKPDPRWADQLEKLKELLTAQANS